MKKIIILVIFLSGAHSSIGQRTLVTTFAGASNYNGEFESKRFTFKKAHIALGIGLLYELTDQLSFSTGIKYGTISGQDAGTINRKRNLSFTSIITELQVGLEYDIINLNESYISPYLFAGIAVFHFDPYTKDSSNRKQYLQELGTEGQGFFMDRKKYALTQFSIPFGGGIKYSFTDNIRVGLEVGFRKTFTDYLDDLSTSYVDKKVLLSHNGPQSVAFAFRGDELKNNLLYPAQGTKRGNPGSKDWYYFTGINVSFRLHDNSYSSRYKKEYTF